MKLRKKQSKRRKCIIMLSEMFLFLALVFFLGLFMKDERVVSVKGENLSELQDFIVKEAS